MRAAAWVLMIALGALGCASKRRPSPAIGDPALPATATTRTPAPASTALQALLAALRRGSFDRLGAMPFAKPLALRLTADNGDTSIIALHGGAELSSCLQGECTALGRQLLGNWQMDGDDGEPAPILCRPAATAGGSCCDVEAVGRADHGLLLTRVCMTADEITSLDVMRDDY
jgi:hypothetical protein